jgi:hypothetical protein
VQSEIHARAKAKANYDGHEVPTPPSTRNQLLLTQHVFLMSQAWTQPNFMSNYRSYIKSLLGQMRIDDTHWWRRVQQGQMQPRNVCDKFCKVSMVSAKSRNEDKKNKKPRNDFEEMDNNFVLAAPSPQPKKSKSKSKSKKKDSRATPDPDPLFDPAPAEDYAGGGNDYYEGGEEAAGAEDMNMEEEEFEDVVDDVAPAAAATDEVEMVVAGEGEYDLFASGEDGLFDFEQEAVGVPDTDTAWGADVGAGEGGGAGEAKGDAASKEADAAEDAGVADANAWGADSFAVAGDEGAGGAADAAATNEKAQLWNAMQSKEQQKLQVQTEKEEQARQLEAERLAKSEKERAAAEQEKRDAAAEADRKRQEAERVEAARVEAMRRKREEARQANATMDQTVDMDKQAKEMEEMEAMMKG